MSIVDKIKTAVAQLVRETGCKVGRAKITVTRRDGDPQNEIKVSLLLFPDENMWEPVGDFAGDGVIGGRPDADEVDGAFLAGNGAEKHGVIAVGKDFVKDGKGRGPADDSAVCVVHVKTHKSAAGARRQCRKPGTPKGKRGAK